MCAAVGNAVTDPPVPQHPHEHTEPCSKAWLEPPFCWEGQPPWSEGAEVRFYTGEWAVWGRFLGTEYPFPAGNHPQSLQALRMVRGGSTSPVATALLVVPGGSYSTPKGAGRGSAPRFTSRAVLPTLPHCPRPRHQGLPQHCQLSVGWAGGHLGWR